MRKDHPFSLLYFALLALLIALAGCTLFRSRQSSANLSPPPPPPPAREAEPAPPDIRPELGAEHTPPVVKAALETAAHSKETTAVIRRAEQHFQAGKSFFEQGDADSARAEFDRAIDTLLDAPADAWDRYRIEEKCEELVEAIYAHDLEGLGSGDRELGFDASPLDDILAATFPVDPNIKLNVSEELKLPVSELPLEVNDAVMKYIRYFSTKGGRKVLVNGLQRQGRYRAMIQRILDEEGIPQELIFMAQTESGFKPRAVSRKRATGMWQFMSLRAREYGLKRTRDYDDRLDPEKATRAAARHLRDLYERLGDWYLAMAAYNAGPGRVNRAVRRTGYADFWEFYYRRALPRETRSYVPIILATIIMANNPGEYGLGDVAPDPPLEYNTIHVGAATHLALIADILGRPTSEIKDLNPAILRDVAPAGYAVHVPKGAGNFVVAALETVPASRRAAWRVHRVACGETLTEIAQQYGTTAESVAVANGGIMEAPKAGDLLVIPVSYSRKRKSSGSSS
jgi:membrane-bound lytic murein transglycosylase D